MRNMATSDQLLGTGLIQDPGSIPLVVAVAGHRDPRLEDIHLLRQQFRSLISELMAQLPSTPIILLNGLAAGMDSEAAEVFLELVADERRKPDRPRHQLVAALPKPRQRYASEDFNSGDHEHARLQRLLSMCDAVLDGSNCVELASRKGSDHSSRCYGMQSEFLVRHCYLLVAFTNGVDSEQTGGTSQTVSMQRGEVYPLFMHVNEVIAAREPGIVVEIATPRISDEGPTCTAGAISYWGENLDGGRLDVETVESLKVPDLTALLNTPHIPARLEAINRELHRYPPAPVYDTGIQSSLWLYADAMANEQKQAYMRLCRAVMVVSVLLGLSISQQEWQAIGLLIVLAAVIMFPKLQQGPKLAFIQWRCLAESLMVTDFWCATGIEADTADLFHSQTNQNFAWIRTVLRARRLQLLSAHSNPENIPAFSAAIDCCKQWISGQERWLGKAISRQQKWDQRYLTLGGMSFLLALLMAIAYTVWEKRIPQLLPETCIGLAVAFFGYRELMGYSDTNARYGRSRSQFARGRKALACAKPDRDDPDLLAYRKRLVVEAVGREKIDELNDWVGDQLQRVYRPGG